jgi:hypothetical protein
MNRTVAVAIWVVLLTLRLQLIFLSAVLRLQLRLQPPWWNTAVPADSQQHELDDTAHLLPVVRRWHTAPHRFDRSEPLAAVSAWLAGSRDSVSIE